MLTFYHIGGKYDILFSTILFGTEVLMDKKNNLTKRMLDFIDSCPTAFHVVDNIARDLLKRGFTELKEDSAWKLGAGD